MAGLEECCTHQQILKIISQNVEDIIENDKKQNEGWISSRCEILENSYMFFISKVSSKGG